MLVLWTITVADFPLLHVERLITITFGCSTLMVSIMLTSDRYNANSYTKLEIFFWPHSKVAPKWLVCLNNASKIWDSETHSFQLTTLSQMGLRYAVRSWHSMAGLRSKSGNLPNQQWTYFLSSSWETSLSPACGISEKSPDTNSLPPVIWIWNLSDFCIYHHFTVKLIGLLW